MKVFKTSLLVAVVLFAANVFAADVNEDRNIWMSMKVGSPFYNMILEADEREVRARWGESKFIDGIRRAEGPLSEGGLSLVTGDRFEINVDTGDLRRLVILTPDITREFKAIGTFFVDVARDSLVIIPLDLLKDAKLALWPTRNTEDIYLSELDLITKQVRAIATDLRSATGLSHHGDYFGKSGVVKIVVSALTISPSGVLNGGWDVIAGVFGATEDGAITVVKFARRGISSTLKVLRRLWPWS